MTTCADGYETTSTMKVLITGFPPFHGQPINPTQQMVDAIRYGELDIPGSEIPKLEILAELLPCEYRGVESMYDSLIESFEPDVALSFGVGRQKTLFRLEEIGVNEDRATIPDNAGELRPGEKIHPRGPQLFENRVDLRALQMTMERSGHVVEISQNAGRYICNHLNYYAQLRMASMPYPSRFLFTHVSTVANGFEIKCALSGVETMLNWFHETTTADDE